MDETDEEESKRLFFGAQVEAPWPDYPPGRIISEETRHITLAFLGQSSFSKLQPLLKTAPSPSFPIGPVGIANELIFLPPEKSRVVALAVKWLDPAAHLNMYQKTLSEWLKTQEYSIDPRPFFPHVTIARAPFDKGQWEEYFIPLPLFVKAIHLYQSLGNLQYKSLWELSLMAPFDELEHTADIAFLVRGSSPQELHRNAEIALGFKFPPLLKFFTRNLQDSLDEIIISLNEIISQADAEMGCPFKAVSFHGNIKMDARGILFWEMIVDV